VSGFGSTAQLHTADGPLTYHRLPRLAELGLVELDRLPFSTRVLLAGALRQAEHDAEAEADVLALLGKGDAGHEVAFRPARVLHQDFNGGAAMVDLAAMRAAVARLGRDPTLVNPVVPTDFVIDHSVQAEFYGSPDAFALNVEAELRQNRERYVFLRWAQQAFSNFRLVPPGTGIVHQINLEYLAQVVQARDGEAVPDTLVGTDSHTTMVNGLGVLGWGVGGIEAEAVMLGRPLYLPPPEVVGVRLHGRLPAGITATDLVLTVTRLLRDLGVVGKFVEFFGPGLEALPLADRATVANMAPEYGATVGFFPVDDETLRYLRATGRPPGLVELVERYTKAQGLFRTADTPEPAYDALLDLDLGSVQTSLAGPRRPHDRVPLGGVRASFVEAVAAARAGSPERRRAEATIGPSRLEIGDGTVAIAAITSCTNTSNPALMIGAGLLAQKAAARGLAPPAYVKTSLAPGSAVVSDYLDRAGLTPALEALGFHLVGFGCTTCAGGSGALPEPVARAVRDNGLVVAAVLSGNRNFEGRINPLCRLAYLASPPLVVAYALAGTVDIDLEREPLGVDRDGRPAYLRELWPTEAEITEVLDRAVDAEQFRARYARVFDGDERWRALPTTAGPLYAWDPASTYIQEPPFFAERPPARDIVGARALVVLGDSQTTDHISPAGSIPADSPAGRYLRDHGVQVRDFNSYGARRGNHEVMTRGTFANVRLRNRLVPGREGGWTRHLPSGEEMPVYDAALRYRAEGVPLVVLAGKDYGAGSSRDWAAKGPALLGVRAVLAESFERIHRSNLVGLGVLPLECADTRQVPVEAEFDITGLGDALRPGQLVTVRAGGTAFPARARLDSDTELAYYRAGGILPFVLRELLQAL
jgi:aconitate hydratase